MRRRSFLGACAQVALAPGLALWPRRAFAQAIVELRRGVGVFNGPGGTIGWLATPGGFVLVDSQFPAGARACLSLVRDRAPGPAGVLINTHHHGDHVGGNGELRAAVQQVVQHEQCAMRVPGLASTTFTERWSIAVGDERVTASYYGAAHTGGDAVVAFENAGVVHLGDLVFNRVPPFIDRAAGASIRNWIAALGTILRQYPGAAFVFGHGRDGRTTGTAADVVRFREYLQAVVDHVQRGIAAGRPPAAIAGITALPGFEDVADLVKDYASPNPAFTLRHVLTAAYDELSAS